MGLKKDKLFNKQWTFYNYTRGTRMWVFKVGWFTDKLPCCKNEEEKEKRGDDEKL